MLLGLGASAADAQLRVVHADGDVTSVGTLAYPDRWSIDDDGAIAFHVEETINLSSMLVRWRDGALTKLAELGAPSPCGTGAILELGNLASGERAVLRGQYAVFHVTDGNAVHHSVGWNNGAITCLASSASLPNFVPWPVTNLAGENLVGNAYESGNAHLSYLPSIGGAASSVIGGGATVPAPAMTTVRGPRQWALDDDGDITALVHATGTNPTVWDYVVHGRPGSLTMLAPTGIGGADTWSVRTFDVSRDGIVAYYASVTPEADPANPYGAIWLGAPGAETKAVQFPAMTTSGVELTNLVGSQRALHVVGGSHLVMHAEYGNVEGTAIARWNAGALEVIARSGTMLRGHPGVMVHGFGGVGVDAAGTVYFQVHTNATMTISGVYRVAVGGDIEKLLAPGDTLQIQGAGETIDAAYFQTSQGTGHGTSVSPTGKIVFGASYQGQSKQVLVTLGAGPPPGPPPNLKLELVEQRSSYSEIRRGGYIEEIFVRITNTGQGAAFPVVLNGSPHYAGCYATSLAELDDEQQNTASGCQVPELASGASIDRVAVFDATSETYDFTLEVFADRDPDQLDNRITGKVRYGTEGDGCATARPRAGAPLLLVTALLLLRRRRSRHTRP